MLNRKNWIFERRYDCVPFVQEKKNLSLRFRGSENQRLIDVQESLKEDKLVLWDDNEGLFEGK